jgi:hypothetical protein
MRNASLFAAAAAAFALFSTGCSSFVPFTYELRSAHRLTDDEVRNLQFYSSHEITLRREVQSQDRQITPGHKLRLLSGRSVEEVVIPAKTPGAAVKISPDVISVSFVSGTSLDFTIRGVRVPLGSYGDLLRPFAVAEGSYRARPPLSPAFLGQYAEPPDSAQRPVKIVRDDSRPPPLRPMDDLAGNYLLAVDGTQVAFGGLMWDAVDQTSQAHLLIDADKLEETEEKRTVLPGVRLGN